jgi:FkbM family methyltransferase
MRLKTRATRLLMKGTGSFGAQMALEWVVNRLELLMGYGGSNDPEMSGEKVLIKMMGEHGRTHNSPLRIFDVGAHLGEFLSLLLKMLPSDSYSIHAFEPSRFSFEKLRGTFGQIPNITLNNCGLGKSAGRAKLFTDSEGSGMASLTRRRLDHFGISFSSMEDAEIQTLDEYCRKGQIEHIDLLKIDVEGHELDVLKGADGMLRQRRIDFVTFEFGGTDIDSKTSFQDFWYFFKSFRKGTIHRLTPSGYLFPIRQYKEIYERYRYSNFVVVFSD